MKKTCILFFALLLSTVMTAQELVKVSYSGRAALEQLFADPNLTVHYYNNTDVIATAGRFDANTMTLLDPVAFADNEVYTLIYCPLSEQETYLGEGEALLRTDGFILTKGSCLPYKNDGAVAIFNKKASLPALTRDFPVVTQENPVIREMLNQVNVGSLEATVQHLQDYGERLWSYEGAYAASDWIAEQMRALGLEVEQQPFELNLGFGGDPAPNVIGIQRGTLHPDTYVVTGSHFDSFSYEAMLGMGDAPGADDNATGVSTVLETARILTQYEFEYSIVYCAFGTEELGLYGSEAYASRCQQQGMEILGYFNNDMNGYLREGDPIHVDCIYPDAVEPIGAYYRNIGSVYYPELPIRHVNFSEGDSDHTSFNNHGYMGIFPFEDYENYSPNIHTPDDLIGPSVNNFDAMKQFCQMNIACIAVLANLAGETPVSCNPVSDFYIEYPVSKDMSWLILHWEAPEAGSTGNLVQYEVYRDDDLIFTLGDDVYEYYDTITEGSQAAYYIMAVYSDGCSAPSETLIGWGFPTGLGELNAEMVQVYPNPAESQLTITANGLQRIAVYNAMGQCVQTIEAGEKDQFTLPVSDYPTGLYTIQVVTANGVVTKSVVVR